MKPGISAYFSITSMLSLGAGIACAYDGTAITTRLGLKVTVTFFLLLLLVTSLSCLFLRSIDSGRKRKIPLFIIAVMATVAIGGIIGLLAAMTIVIVIEDLFAISVYNWIRMLITFLVGSLIVFAAIRLAAGKIINYPGVKVKRLAFVLTLFTNIAAIILLFELINRIIK